MIALFAASPLPAWWHASGSLGSHGCCLRCRRFPLSSSCPSCPAPLSRRSSLVLLHSVFLLFRLPSNVFSLALSWVSYPSASRPPCAHFHQTFSSPRRRPFPHFTFSDVSTHPRFAAPFVTSAPSFPLLLFSAFVFNACTLPHFLPSTVVLLASTPLVLPSPPASPYPHRSAFPSWAAPTFALFSRALVQFSWLILRRFVLTTSPSSSPLDLLPSPPSSRSHVSFLR